MFDNVDIEIDIEIEVDLAEEASASSIYK